MADPPSDKPPGTAPSPFQRRSLWVAVTALSLVVTGSVAVGLVWLGATVLSYLQPVLVPLAVAGIIAYLLDPVVKWLAARGLPQRTATTVVFATFLILVALLVVAVVVPTAGQAQEFYEQREAYQEQVSGLVTRGMEDLRGRFAEGVADDYYQRAVEWISTEGPSLAAAAGQWLWERFRGAFGLIGYAIGFLLVPVYLFYFLREGTRISETWTDYLPLRASEFKNEVAGTIGEINGYLISFFRGQMVVSLIDGALVAIALSLMGLPYALLIGVFLAILGLIPYIGNLLVMIPAVVISIAHFGATGWGEVQGAASAAAGETARVKLETSGRVVERTVVEVSGDGASAEVLLHAWSWLPQVWAYPLIVVLVFVVLQQVNSLFTAPRIVGDSVGLHPLTVIFSVLFWSLVLGGLLGALLAVPLTASVKVVFRRYVWEGRIEPAMARRRGGGGEEGRAGGDGEDGAEDSG